MKTNIHHIELSHTSPHISGGETALIEIVKYLSSDENIIQYIYTSESGVEVLKKGIGIDFGRIIFVVIGKRKIENFNEYFAFYFRIIEQFFYLRRFDNSTNNLIFSHEEFLPTLLFSYFLKKINNNAKWFALFHMKAPGLFRGFEGEYTKKLRLPSLRLLRYNVEQWIFFALTKKNINKLITVNLCYEDFLKRIYADNLYVLKIFGGESIINIKKCISNDSHRREYDLSFMARFHEQKGIFELIKILKIIKEFKPDISIVVMGGGSKRMETIFLKRAKRECVLDNIHYLGYVMGDEKYSILMSSKVFVFPSYYESFGQVILEAMKCGLPVVVYDLPPFNVFKGGVVKVPILDNKKMALEVLKLLSNDNYYTEKKREAGIYSSYFSWEKTGEEIKLLIKEVF